MNSSKWYTSLIFPQSCCSAWAEDHAPWAIFSVAASWLQVGVEPPKSKLYKEMSNMEPPMMTEATVKGSARLTVSVASAEVLLGWSRKSGWAVPKR